MDSQPAQPPETVATRPLVAAPPASENLHRGQVAVALVCIAVAGVLLVYVARSQWFFGDEWDFILHRSAGSFSDLMRPHNEHWSAIPILAYRGVFSVFSLTSYVPYLVLLGALHVTIALLVYVLLVREGAPWPFAVVVGIGLVLFGSGAENLVWAFQIGFVGSLAAFLGAVVLLQRGPDRWRDIAAAALLVVSAMSSALGFAAVAAVLAALLARREWSRALRVTGVPILLCVTWAVAYRDSILGAHEGSRVDAILLLPRYVVTGLTAALEGALGGRSFGPLLLLTAAVCLVLWAIPRVSVASIAVLAPLAMAVFVFVLAGLGRAAVFGVEQATAPRYVHVVGVLLVVGLGSAFFSSATFRRLNGRRLTIALCVAAALIVGLNLAALRDFARDWTSYSSATRTAALATILAIDGAQPGDLLESVQPVALNPDIDVRSVGEALAAADLRLSESDVAGVTTDQIADARALMQVQWTDSEPAGGLMRAEVEAEAAIVPSPAGAGCLEVAGVPGATWLVVIPAGGGVARITPSVTGELLATSTIDGTFPPEAAAHASAEAGSAYWLSVAPSSTAVRVDVPAGGSASVCLMP